MIRTFSQAIGEQNGVEHIPSDSITVPDMSLSVKEILNRFRRGTIDPLTLYRNSIDTNDDIDDDTLDDINDLVDIHNLKIQTNETILKHLAGGNEPAVSSQVHSGRNGEEQNFSGQQQVTDPSV